MEVDVYGDLDDFNNQYGAVQQENDELKETIEKLEQTSMKFSIEISELRRVNTRLETNISILYKTAKAELERKNIQIADLRKDLDDMYFKKGPKKKGPPPKKNDTQDDQVLNKQFEKAQHDLQQKNKIIQSLHTELDNVRKELEEKKRSLADDDYENNSFNKRRKLEKETFVENEKEYRNYKDRFERRNTNHFKSRFNYDSKGHRHNNLRSRIELKRLSYHRSRSRSRENKNYRGSRRNSPRERSSDATDDSHEHDRNFRYNLNRIERSNSFFSRHTPDRTYTPESELQYSSREEIRSSSIENYRTGSRKHKRSRSQSRRRYLEDKTEPVVYDQNLKNNRVDNEISTCVTEKIDCDSGIFNSQITESTCTPEPQYSPIVSSCEEGELDSTNLSIKHVNLKEDKPNIINQNDLEPKETEQKISKLLDTSVVDKEIITNKTCIKIENVEPEDSSNLKVKTEEIQLNVEKRNILVEKFSQEVNDSVVDESSKIVSKTTNSKTDDVKLKSDISEKSELVASKSKSNVSEKSEAIQNKIKTNEEAVTNKTKSNKENEKNKLISDKETVKDKSKSENESGKRKSKSEKETGKSKSKTEKETVKTKLKSEKESEKNKKALDKEVVKDTSKSADKKSDSNKSSKSKSRTKSEKSCKDKSKIKSIVKLKSETKVIKSNEDKDVKITEVNNSEISNIKSYVINETNMSFIETKSNTQPEEELNFSRSKTNTESLLCLTNETKIPFLETNSNTQVKSELNFLQSETKTESHTYLINETNMPILEIKSNIQSKRELNFLESKIKTTESNEEKNDKTKDASKTKVVENKEINVTKNKRDSNIYLVIGSNCNNSYEEIINVPSPVSNIQFVSELSKTQSEEIKKRFEFEKQKLDTEETKSDKNTPETIRKDNENDVSTNIMNISEINASEIKNSPESACDSSSQSSSSTTVSNTLVLPQPPNRGRRRRCVISIS